MADGTENNPVLDSTIIEDNTQLLTLKRVLEKEFNISSVALLTQLREYEDKQHNTVEKTLTLPAVIVNKLDAILISDGIAEPAESDYAAWIDLMVENTYDTYRYDGRFDELDNPEANSANGIALTSVRTTNSQESGSAMESSRYNWEQTDTIA